MSRIRSYVLRQTRLTRLQQEAYTLHSPRFCIPYRSERVDFHAEFAHRTGDHSTDFVSSSAGNVPVVLEIGFGMGEATVELALAMSETCFVAVDVHKPGIGKVLSEIAAQGLSNLLLIHHDVVPVLTDMIAPRSLTGVHLFFPDPWPKKKHHKRRLVQPPFARLLATRIRPGGYLYAATDWEEYADQMQSVFDAIGSLTNKAESCAGNAPRRPRTAFERKGLEKKHRIFELSYRKAPGPRANESDRTE